MKNEIYFGIIGCGLMGREFASAAARWCHLTDNIPRPVITSVCDIIPANRKWFTDNFSSITSETNSYQDILNNPKIDAVYCAVPHNLHEQFYIDIIKSGKHLLGEKPFGIDKKANDHILQTIEENPGVIVRCSSEFPFAPAMQAVCSMIENNEFGDIIQVDSGFIHSSDLNPLKPINWKRMINFNGEYGCMGDLGMHPCHIPFRAGWIPTNVRAILSNIIPERPVKAGSAEMTPCETWDNATMFCEAEDSNSGKTFPLTIRTMRIAPGETNTWYISILGTKASAKFSTKNINIYERLIYSPNGDQNWETVDIGHAVIFSSITGGIFEFGFSDAILQMWASFLFELSHKGEPKSKFAGCVTPEETALSHKLFTAALVSHKTKQVVDLIN